MPYIKPERRTELAENPVARNAGELNYLLTKSCLAEVDRLGLCYDTINIVISDISLVQYSVFPGFVHPLRTLSATPFRTLLYNHFKRSLLTYAEGVGAFEC